MPKFEGKAFNIVFIGRQNPQILNHDFLKSHHALPENIEPFRSLLDKKDAAPFSEFVSTPVLSMIKYGPISIVVEENRYQITDSIFTNATSSPILGITKKYFGDLLRYTPLQLGGVNLIGNIHFKDAEDEKKLDQLLGINRDRLIALSGVSDIRSGLSFSFPWKEGMIEVQVTKLKDRSQPAAMTFNYEFRYKDIDSFLRNLDLFPEILVRFKQLCGGLGMEIQ
ncbi:MAG: hypothetical protein MCM46_12200 [Candidatus Manganitrophus sp. SB1]|nr:hypothetical protein [Candidatus Manganitrophus morganii]